MAPAKFMILLLCALAALFAAAPVAEAKGKWCHKSGYDGVSCAKARAAKRQLWTKCAIKASAFRAVFLLGIRLTTSQETCTRRPGRCSYTVVQTVVGSKAVWDRYDKCEHAQKIYISTFTRRGANLGNKLCKYDRAC